MKRIDVPAMERKINESHGVPGATVRVRDTITGLQAVVFTEGNPIFLGPAQQDGRVIGRLLKEALAKRVKA